MKHKTANRLCWLLVVTVVFTFSIAVVLTERSKAQTCQKTPTEKGVIDRSYLEEWDIEHQADKIFDKYIKNSKEFQDQYQDMRKVLVTDRNKCELLYISWVEYIRNFDILDLDNPIQAYLWDEDFMVEKFQQWTDYCASDILAETLPMWDRNNY